MLGTQPSLTAAKQLYHLELAGGECELALPDTHLQDVIDYYWLLSIHAPSLRLQVIPDTAVDLVLSPDLPDFAALYFPANDRFSIALEGPIRYVGTCFRAARIQHLLHAGADTLSPLGMGVKTVRRLHLEPLLHAIQDCTTLSEMTACFNTFWLSRQATTSIPEPCQGPLGHDDFLEVLERAAGVDNIATICRTLGVSERQFRRRSHSLFGISPKKLQSILRLQTALDELFQCERSQLQDLYYDDSHRIRELKRLTGCTPGQIRRMAEKYNNA